MKIAIIGAGFAGSSVSHFLGSNCDITFYDDPITSASRIAAGLLHKFVGMHSRKNPFADEALKLSLEIIGPKTKTGLLRIAKNQVQADSFKKALALYPDEIEKVDDNSIWIPEAWVVDCPAYLAPLPYIPQKIKSLSELDHYDKIIITAGADSLLLADLPINPVGGQLLEVRGKNYPTTPISGEIYVIPLKDSMIVGSTYERSPQNAQEVLLPKLKELLPHFELEEVIAVKAGVRASTKDHMPFIQQVNEKTWALSGFGSKGLLYHGLYGQRLANLIKEA